MTCPKCGKGCIIEGHRGYGCNRYREGCDFVVWKEIAGKRLTESDLRVLIERGETRLIRGLIDETGNRLDARLRLDEQWKPVLESGGIGSPTDET